MLHNTGTYGSNETPINMGAPINISQLSSPMKMVQNLNNLAKMPPQPPQTASGHYNLPNYQSYGNPPTNVSPQMLPFPNYHSFGFQPSYLPDRSSTMLNSGWPSSMQPMAMNMPGDHAQNMLNYAHMDKIMTQPQNHYKDEMQPSKMSLNIPQIPNKLYQTHSDPAPSSQETYNNHYKPYDTGKPDNLDLCVKSPEGLLSDNTRRKNLENTVRLIENILINTTKNREMELHNECNENSKKSSDNDGENAIVTESAIVNEKSRESFVNDDDKTNDASDGMPEESDTMDDSSNDSKSKIMDKSKKSESNSEESDKEHHSDQCNEDIEMVTLEISPVIKQEPLDMDKQVEVKIEQISSWTDTDSKNPFHRDVNGVTREDAVHGNIVDSETSVVEATEIVKNRVKSDSYFECPHCCLLFEHPKRFLIHTKWHSFGPVNSRRIELAKEKYEKKKAQRLKKLEETPVDQHYTCKQCDKVFPSKSSLDNHRQRCHPNRTRECKICLKQITGWGPFKAHLATHNTEAGYQCNECPKRFKYSHSLAKHKDTHLEKTEKCPECPKKFGSQALLKVHMKSHERAKQGASFHCTFCGKSFYDKFNLQIHERTHTNERPFVCEICNATFGCNSNLSRHLKVSHSASKPYVCSTCSRSFATELIRDRHELRMHGDPNEFKYTCKHCPSRYMKQVDLRKHTYKMHRKPKNETEATK